MALHWRDWSYLQKMPNLSEPPILSDDQWTSIEQAYTEGKVRREAIVMERC